MSNNDYFVLAYKILAYLYTQLKAGEDVDPAMLAADGPLLKIPEKYREYILDELKKDGFVRRSVMMKSWGNRPMAGYTDKLQITPEGIAFLTENSLMEKAKDFLKVTKEMIPFV